MVTSLKIIRLSEYGPATIGVKVTATRQTLPRANNIPGAQVDRALSMLKPVPDAKWIALIIAATLFLAGFPMFTNRTTLVLPALARPKLTCCVIDNAPIGVGVGVGVAVVVIVTVAIAV